MKKIFPVLFVAILANFYPVSSNGGCKFDEVDGYYFCFEATYGDIKEIPKNAQDIRIAKSKLHDLPPKAFAAFNLTKLSFVITEIRSISSNAFDGLPNLQLLMFYESLNHYDRIKTSWFGKLNSLIYLSISEHTVRHIDSDFFSLVPNLTTLRLEKSNLCCLEIAPLKSLKKLNCVMFGVDNDHCSSTSDIIGWLKNEQKIYRRNFPMERPKEVITPQRKDPEIPSTELRVRTVFAARQVNELEINEGNEISIVSDTLNSLRFISDDVRSIKFSNSEITEIPESAFQRFGNSLITLSFLNCSIRTIHPNAFKGLYKLKNLSLFNNSFSAVRSKWFESLRNLEYLALEGNEIEYIHLRVFPMLRNLKYLNIANNKIECIPVNKFGLLKNLEQIFLAYNPWDCQCHEILRKWLHKQKIRYVTSRGPCENGTILMTDDLFEQNFEMPNKKFTAPTDADEMEDGQFENAGSLVSIFESQVKEIANEN
ncbi:carboxypeptidase N subunit 2-like [Athalia rosae]|uniref:carboxypeptidase N subunit 2-like n=1 Tax=Athalia rosae TaxID=37344 RepID=UPI0020337E91|nr:carboxypeptidase N subunit 2-like [Athalia rosae]XP_048505218.1 carboxypeptidase N subunit 2-like [Athalia rosae]